jgi:hypothetical protein
MRDKLVKIFTNLTFIFVGLTILEVLLGLYTENYMEGYSGSFFADELPYIFVLTILLSVLSNVAIVIVEYFNRNGNN